MRFVVLHHTGWPGHPDHYDLLLQFAKGGGDDDPVLRAFATLTDAFPAGACRADGDAAARPTLLLPLPDHRRLYLRHEGPLSSGRGRVARVDEGECTLLPAGEPGWPELQVRLSGAKLRGFYVLRRRDEAVYSFERTDAGPT